MGMACPQCGSPKIRTYKKDGKNCIECSECYYDSCALEEQYPEEKTSQREKGRYTNFLDGALIVFVVLLVFFASGGSNMFESKKVNDVTRLVNTYYDENEPTNDSLQNSIALVTFLEKAKVNAQIVTMDEHYWVLVETTENNFLPVETLHKSFVYGQEAATYAAYEEYSQS